LTKALSESNRDDGCEDALNDYLKFYVFNRAQADGDFTEVAEEKYKIEGLQKFQDFVAEVDDSSCSSSEDECNDSSSSDEGVFCSQRSFNLGNK